MNFNLFGKKGTEHLVAPYSRVVSAKYEGEDTELVTDENINIEEQTEGSAKIYSCVISKPLGYDDALKSGKNIKKLLSSTNIGSL